MSIPVKVHSVVFPSDGAGLKLFSLYDHIPFRVDVNFTDESEQRYA